METNQRHRGTKRLSDYRKILTEMPYCDGFEWRKYGEKDISGLTFTRCYYRCTNSPCSAKKRVEQYSNGDPPMYLVTYEKEHTCKAAQSTALRQEPMSHASPNSPFLFNSVNSPNMQTGRTEEFQLNPSFNTEVIAPGSIEIETKTPECVSLWSNMPTSPLSIDQMGIFTSEGAFDEPKVLPPTLSFTAHGSHGETSPPHQGNIADFRLNLPAAPELILIGSMLVESYSFDYADEPEHLPSTLSLTAQGGHEETGAVDKSNVVIPSSDQTAAPGMMISGGFMEMERHDSVFDSSLEFKVDYSGILEPWELLDFHIMNWLADPL